MVFRYCLELWLKKMGCSMNKFIISTLMISFIFWACQVRYFLIANKTAPTSLFAAGFLVCVLLYLIAFFLFIKFQNQLWTNIEVISVIVVLISMLLLSLTAAGIDVSMRIIEVTGYISVLLGIIGACKNKHKVDVTFIIWGVFILIWVTNWYESNYLSYCIE